MLLELKRFIQGASEGLLLVMHRPGSEVTGIARRPPAGPQLDAIAEDAESPDLGRKGTGRDAHSDGGEGAGTSRRLHAADGL